VLGPYFIKPFLTEVFMEKNYVRLAICLAGIMIIGVLTGCTKEGPAGVAGKDGSSAKLEGFADSVNCGLCHNADLDTTYHVNGRTLEYQNSVHATGGAFTENGASCAECHTTEGYIQKQSGMAVTVASTPTPPGCFACHSPHTNGNFVLRTTNPVTLTSNIKNVASATFDYGDGNLCVSCHHPRTLNPLAPDPTITTATDTLTTSTRWYPHYGVQGQMLMGVGGYELQNGTAYNTSAYYHGNATAIKQNGCSLCHMVAPTAQSSSVGQLGGHTMTLETTINGSDVKLLNGCNITGCHSSLTSFDHNGMVTTIQSYMDTLKTLLVAKNWIDTSNNIKTVKITPAIRSGALYNYMFVLHDKSGGVHNAEYALALLKNSLVEIRK
jgi:hypothetical protein